MFPLIGAAGSALSILNTILQSSAASNAAKTGGNIVSSLEQTLTGNGSQAQQPVTGSGQGAPSLSSGTLATLIALQGQSGSNQQGGLFAKLDTDGDGSISQSEFQTSAANAGVDTSSADALFAKLDANGDGSISRGEMAKARGGHHHHHGGGGGGGISSLLNATDLTGASSQTSTNSDGSSSTTITYADGSTVTMTTPAASSTSANGTSGNTGGTQQANLLEQLIKLQSQLTAQNGGATASTTA